MNATSRKYVVCLHSDRCMALVTWVSPMASGLSAAELGPNAKGQIPYNVGAVMTEGMSR